MIGDPIEIFDDVFEVFDVNDTTMILLRKSGEKPVFVQVESEIIACNN